MLEDRVIFYSEKEIRMNANLLQRYVDAANKHLKLEDKRSLTAEEQDIVLTHLSKIVMGYSEDKYSYDLMSLLCMECVKKVCEIHPDKKAITDDIANQWTMETLAKMSSVLNETQR